MSARKANAMSQMDAGGKGSAEVSRSASQRTGHMVPVPFLSRLEQLPWWIVILILGGVIAAFVIFTNSEYISILQILSDGIRLTLYLTFAGYATALVLGLIAALGRISKNVVIRTVATLYVEVVRGIPLLVQIYYVFAVIAPAVASIAPENLRGWMLNEENMAIVAMGFCYGAYLAETYRAGIESIPRGQMEAARSLGMSYVEAMRYVILPQAIRVVLPPLGNDFIAMLKDSSLASAIGVKELTLWTKNRSAATFRALPHWTIAALLYLVMTLGLSIIVRYVERRWAIPK